MLLVEDAQGEPLSVGRKSRVVPQAIKRALWSRDKGCRFPGCGRRHFVDAHHVKHWSAGGETCLGNLMLLCSNHHTLVHEGAFRIEKDYQDRWFFRRPDGRAEPTCGYRASDMRDENVAAHPSAEGWSVAEPSAEVYLIERSRDRKTQAPSVDILNKLAMHHDCGVVREQIFGPWNKWPETISKNWSSCSRRTG
jgi:hypothetical protein